MPGKISEKFTIVYKGLVFLDETEIFLILMLITTLP